MKIRSQKDFYSGLMFTGVGGAFVWGATSYKVGDAARMGPGYFPTLLGTIMVILGIAVTVGGLGLRAERGDDIGRWAWKPLAYILSANFVFGVLLGGLPSLSLPSMGLFAGVYALTIIAGLAGERFNLREALVLATILAIGSYLAFIVLCQLRFPLWPTFLSQ